MSARVGRDTLLALVLVLLAFALRLYHLGEQSLWYDEAHSLILAHREAILIVSAIARDTMPPLHYLFLHLWGLLGGGDFYMRFPSALFSALCVPLVYRLAARLVSQRVGLLASAITVLSPFQVYFGQEARMYSLLALLTLLSAVSLMEAGAGSHSGSRASSVWWLTYAAAAALALYVHALAGLTLLSVAAAAAVYFRDLAGYRRRLAVWTALALALFAPWGVALARQSVQVAGSFWVAPPTPVAPVASLFVFLYGASLPFWLLPLGIFLPISAVALPVYTKIRRGDLPLRALMEEKRLEIFLALWLGLPLLGLYLISLVRPLYLDKVVIGASFAWYIALALALSSPWAVHSSTGSHGGEAKPASRWMRASTAAALGVLALVGLSNWYFQPAYEKPPLKAAASYIHSNWRGGDIVLHTSDGSFLPFQLYAPWAANHLLYGDPELLEWTARARSTYGALEFIPTRLEELPLGEGRLWLVVALDHSREFQVDAAREIDGLFKLTEAREIGGIFVRLYERG